MTDLQKSVLTAAIIMFGGVFLGQVTLGSPLIPDYLEAYVFMGVSLLYVAVVLSLAEKMGVK